MELATPLPAVEPAAGRAWSGAWRLSAAGALATCAAYLAGAFLLEIPDPGLFWAGLTSSCLFWFLLAAVPAFAARPDCSYLNPRNWALFLFFLQLVLMPSLVALDGPAQGLLPHLPSEGWIEVAIVIKAATFGAFAAGYSWASRRLAAAPASASTGEPSRPVLWVYLALGLAGLLVVFPNPAALILALTDPSQVAPKAEGGASLAAAASTALRPFLMASGVIAWCRAVKGSGSRWVHLGSTLGIVALSLVISASYSFNRASFVVPLIAMLAAYSTRIGEIPVRWVLAAACVLGGLMAVIGVYRAERSSLTELMADPLVVAAMSDGAEPSAVVQVYGAAPQFEAFALEGADRGEWTLSPYSFFCAVVYAVPVLAKPLRADSPSVGYNRLIYGSGVLDQIITYSAELTLCFGPLGLVLGFLLLGAAVAWLQRRFEEPSSLFTAYCIQYSAIWLLYLVYASVEILSQIVVFLAWPIFVHAWLTARDRAPGARRTGSLAGAH